MALLNDCAVWPCGFCDLIVGWVAGFCGQVILCVSEALVGSCVSVICFLSSFRPIVAL